MDLAAQLARTDTTAAYPDAGTGSATALTYVALGLVGEATELLQKATLGDTHGVTAEAGDVFWYWLRLHVEVGLKPTDTYPLGPIQDATPPQIALTIAAGRVAELAKKTLRDDAGVVTGTRRWEFVHELGVVAGYWRALLEAKGLDPAAVADANATKLAARAANGTISGSGDYR